MSRSLNETFPLSIVSNPRRTLNKVPPVQKYLDLRVKLLAEEI